MAGVSPQGAACYWSEQAYWQGYQVQGSETGLRFLEFCDPNHAPSWEPTLPQGFLLGGSSSSGCSGFVPELPEVSVEPLCFLEELASELKALEALAKSLWQGGAVEETASLGFAGGRRALEEECRARLSHLREHLAVIATEQRRRAELLREDEGSLDGALRTMEEERQAHAAQLAEERARIIDLEGRLSRAVEREESARRQADELRTQLEDLKRESTELPRFKKVLLELCCCPLTFALLQSPLLGPDGHTYSARAIRKWLSQTPASPFSRLPMTPAMMLRNHFAAQLVELARERWPKEIAELEDPIIQEEEEAPPTAPEEPRVWTSAPMRLYRAPSPAPAPARALSPPQSMRTWLDRAGTSQPAATQPAGGRFASPARTQPAASPAEVPVGRPTGRHWSPRPGAGHMGLSHDGEEGIRSAPLVRLGTPARPRQWSPRPQIEQQPGTQPLQGTAGRRQWSPRPQRQPSQGTAGHRQWSPRPAPAGQQQHPPLHFSQLPPPQTLRPESQAELQYQ